MQTEDAKVVNDAQGVFVNLPLAKPTGKMRVFGMLSAKHRHDVLAILELLFPDLRHDG